MWTRHCVGWMRGLALGHSTDSRTCLNGTSILRCCKYKESFCKDYNKPSNQPTQQSVRLYIFKISLILNEITINCVLPMHNDL